MPDKSLLTFAEAQLRWASCTVTNFLLLFGELILPALLPSAMFCSILKHLTQKRDAPASLVSLQQTAGLACLGAKGESSELWPQSNRAAET